ncbi:MAG: DUF1351 domain-containing protein [Clostridia bacterium]|nr:DUF1351 domain-containing protein [Clostridia bacterium]
MSDIALAEIKVTENKPAVVNFNYQEISDHLDTVLDKYKNLVFTESTVSECKKTIAELRKGQKALDEFRKDTKKQLTESVTAFENKCKTLYGRFDEVIKPLTEQQVQFELDRKKKKHTEIQSLIDELKLEKELTDKYYRQLDILPEYYNKGKSMKAIKTELTTRANTLKVQQDKEQQDINLIKTKVELANVQYQLSNGLLPANYLRLLAYKTTVEIEVLITSDAEQARARETTIAKQVETVTVEAPSLKTFCPAPVEVPKIFSVANPVIVSNTDTEELITVTYEITGTEEQLSALEAYLDVNKLKWSDQLNE